MKKKIRILLIVLAIAACTIGIAIGALAADGTDAKASAPWQYVNSSGVTQTADTLGAAASSAKAGTTITLLSNTTEVANEIFATFDREITVDLNGKTYNMVQEGNMSCISVKTTAAVKFMNGTIVASGNSTLGTASKGYAVFKNDKPDSNLTLENLNTYSACLVLDGWAGSMTLNITGGEHHVVFGPAHIFCGGLVETRKNTNVIVTGAKIFVGAGRHLAASMIYNDATAETKYSNYTFTDCDIVSLSGDSELIKYANPYTSIVFDGCNIYGKLNPEVRAEDANNGFDTIPDGVIRLTGGTKLGSSAQYALPASVAAGDGDAVSNIYESRALRGKISTGSLYYDAASGSVADADFKVADGTVSYTLTSIYGESDEALVIYDFYGKEYVSDDINYAINNADSYIKLTSDYELDPAIISGAIDRDLTINLGTYILTVNEALDTDTPIYIAAGRKLTVVGGNIERRENGRYTNGYSIFEAAGDNVTLTLRNVVVRAGSLINNASYKGITVNITGGTNNATDAPSTAIGGYIQTNAGVTVNANDTVFVSDKDSAVASVIGSERAIFNFVDSSIVESSATAPTKNFEYLNENTEIIFNNCIVYGIINPVPHESDTADAMKQGSIKMLAGTRISDPSEYIGGGVIATDSDKVFKEESIKQAVKYLMPTGTLRTVNAPMTHVVANPSADAVVSYASGAIAVEGTDLKAAIAAAAEGTVIRLFKDVKLVESEKNFSAFNVPVTLDLGGHTITLVQQGEAHFVTYADITIKNGTLMAAMDKNAGASAGKSYPMLCYAPGAKGLTVTFDNVNTYGGSMVFTWNCSDHTLNVIGGTHVAYNRGTGNDNGWLDVRGNFTLNATGARFIISDKSYVVSALSFKDTDTTKLDSYFNFTGCTLAAYGGKATLIGFANEYSHFNFTACDIYGSLNPKLNTNDESAGYSAIGVGGIVIGSKTRFNSHATHIGGGVITYEQGVKLIEREYSCYINYNSYSVNTETGEIILTPFTISAAFATAALNDEDAKYTVIFYGEDGITVVGTFKVSEGEAVTPPSYTPTGSNGFFKASYKGWATTFASNQAVSDFTVWSDMAYYPAVDGEITPSFTAGLYNLTLVGKIRNNIYIPTATGGVKIIGVYDNLGNNISARTVVLDGKYYNMYMTGEIGATQLTSDSVITVKFSVGGVEYSHNITLNVAKYAKNVLDDSAAETHVYNEAAYTLVADLVRYSNYLSIAINGAGDATLEGLLASYSNLCSDLPADVAFSNYVSNTTGLVGVIDSIQLEVSSMEPKWRFNIASGVSVKEINLSVKGYLPSVVDGVNFGTVTYTARSDGGRVFYTENIPMYNLDRLMTIEVTLENGTVKTGTYNLDAYYTGFELVDAAQDVKEFLKAFRAFAVSSAGYKYGAIIMDEKTGEDFFVCDHENLGAFNSGKGRFCDDCGTYIFFYSDYGAVADGVSDRAGNGSGTNDFMSIFECHKAANTYKLTGAKVAVMAVGGAHGGNSFYIGAPDNNASISIKTDVNWSGANMIVDDTTVKQADPGYKLPIFKLVRDYNSVSYTSVMSDGIKEGATNIGFAPGNPMMIHLLDKSQQEYIRSGINNPDGSGVSFAEDILVDEYGNISKSTPLQHTFKNVDFCTFRCTPVDADANNTCDTCGKSIVKSFSATGYRVDDNPIKVSGLDKNGNINFTWENITDDTVDLSTYDQCQRVIRVERSNVVIEGIDHIFTEDDTKDTPRQTYAGIVNTQYANNVVIKDVLVQQHISHYRTDGALLGSYEFSGGNSINVSWINCVTKNFFWDDGTITYRGMFGTNYMRNMYFKDCVLASMDSHSGAHNITMEDCTFEHINYVGGGDVVMKNITVYTDPSYQMAIHLRQDYGAHWKGNIYIDGLRIRYHSSKASSISNLDVIRAYYTNEDFGMVTYLPIEVHMNNVTTEQYSRTTSVYTYKDGMIDENITATNAKPIAIYRNINANMKNDYDYSTSNANNLNPKKCTDAIYLSNIGPTVVYPNHPFFKDMKVYVDGTLKTNWFTKSSSIKCTDKNADKVCETCFKTIDCTADHTGNSSGSCSTCNSVITSTSSGSGDSGDNCVTGDTLVTLADGTQKRIDELTGDELILVFDHFTGEYIAAPIVVYENDGVKEYEVVALTFSDGTRTRLIYEHGYFNKTLNKYVYIHADDAVDYIGDEFVIVGAGGEFTTATLTNVAVTREVVGCYSIATAYDYGFIADGVLSIPGGIAGIFNIFEYGEDLAYDEEKMQSDIDEYGLYTYRDFAPYVTEEIFHIFNAQYFKVAVGKGMITFEEIVDYIQKYL